MPQENPVTPVFPAGIPAFQQGHSNREMLTQSLHSAAQVSSYSKPTMNAVILMQFRLNEDIFIPG